MSVDRNEKSMSGSNNSLTKVTPSEDFKITDQKKRQKDVENGITVLSWNSIHSDSPPEKVEGGVTKGSVLDSGQKDVDENEEEGCCGPAGQPAWKVTVNILLIILAGIIFGWSMEKSRVFEPASIRLQMIFRRWIMLKMFLTAAAMGQLTLLILSLVPSTKQRFQESMVAFGCSLSDKGFLTCSVGPFILGIGLTLSGACPGMVLIQIGAWAKNGIWTYIGALIGALLYGLFAPWIVKISRPKNPLQIQTVHEKLNLSFAVVAGPVCFLLALTVLLMEIFIPWEEDLDCWNRNSYVNKTSNIFVMKSWPPSASGLLVGVLQLFIVLTVGDTLGGSSSYVTLVSQWVVTRRLQGWFPYLARARCGMGNWWQVVYVGSAIFGGLFSALASDSLATAQGVSIPSAFFGGMCLLLGARFGSGCTSGHGLSGMAMLFWLSWVAVPAMFGGAIAVGFCMYATDSLYDWQCHSNDPYCYAIPYTQC